MAGMFGALDAASSGATLANTWLDAISDNVANVNTVRPAGEEPFRARLVVAESVQGTGNGPGEGVRVGRIDQKGGEPQQVFDPDNPLADADGYVTRPQVDLAEEMANMMMATRSYQANLSVIDRVRDAYQRALQIGRT
jgi:flagellar basal-body rod protein FlgC